MFSTKYIFVCGGVCSGLGKGIAAASIGAILKACGYKVSILKFDPYLNVDPGTMNPYQHGEVFVLDDGTETDLDLGHYERFVDENLDCFSNLTSGQIYKKLISQERKGKFLGKTIQVVPHVTETIKDFIKKAVIEKKPDFLICEIGGTVGDIEGEPCLEAAREWHREKGDKNVLFVLLTLLPFLKPSGELKTKPTQMAVREIRRQGIQPDIILARSDYPISQELIEKIALFCDVLKEAVIPAPTIKSIYQVPLNFQKNDLAKIIFKKFDLKNKKPDLKKWEILNKKIEQVKQILKIGIVGKYIEQKDSYLSLVEALKTAGFNYDQKIKIEWLSGEKLEKDDKNEWKKIKEVKGIIVPGGFGTRGIEGKIKAAEFARKNKIPYLGLCLGMQIAVIEFARFVLKTKDVHSSEIDHQTKNPVIDFIPEQKKFLKNKKIGASMRLGAYPCFLKKGTLADRIYKNKQIFERHRHRYEFNNLYRERLEKQGLIISGTSLGNELVEIIELSVKDHPFFIGVQFHPEYKSRPLKPHPLFRAFVKACIK